MSSTKPLQKKGKPNTKPNTKAVTASKANEQRELAACKTRIQREFNLFSKLNPMSFQQSLQLRHEPKMVKLDSEFASGAKTSGSKIRSHADLYSTEATEQFQGSIDGMPTDMLRRFNTLPISTRTKRALADNKYSTCTRVQHASLPSSLAHQDLFVLSCTGSGKTLAFVIPVLETLWQQRWTSNLGLGALIIEPTRELALQTFHALRRIGAYHQFSAGLLIGGTSFEEERRVIADMNILVCTPGRLIHHLEHSSGLDLTNLVSLVIDECDHLLDIGFAEQFETIAPLLPSKKRLAKAIAQVGDDSMKKQLMQGQAGFHTMLFSATISPQVQKFAKRVLSPDLRLISLINPQGNNPDNLTHRFLVCSESDKLRTLYEFLRVHNSNKSIIFVSTARQASFLYELFRAVSIRAPVHRLHSKLGPQSRTQEYYQFQQERYGVLICTDVAARGLDLTGVSYVIHFDCPTSVTQYIHRSGRTARLKGSGTNVLILTPHQLRFAHLLHFNNPRLGLQQSKLPPFITDFHARVAKIYSERPQIKTAAERAVTSYLQHLIHERTDCLETLATLVPDADERATLLRLTGTDLLKAAKAPRPWLHDLQALKPAPVTAFNANLFNVAQVDAIGLCRSYGLKVVPIVITPDDQLDADAAAPVAAKPEKKSGSDKKPSSSASAPGEDDVDQELAVLTRVNVELEEFLKRTRLLEAAQAKSSGASTPSATFFTKSTKQPKVLDTIGNRAIAATEEDVVCDVLTTWSDDELDDETRQARLTDFDPDAEDHGFAQLKRRYLEIDADDKQFAKDVAASKRRRRKNYIKLERLRKLGYRLTIEELEDMLAQKEAGKKVDFEFFRRNKGGDGSDDDGQGADDILDGLSDSSDEDDDDASDGDNSDGRGGFGFAVHGDGDDDDDDGSDSGNEFHQMMKKQAQEKQQRRQQQASMLDEDSDSDDGDDSDRPAPVARASKSLLNESSDDGSSDSDTPPRRQPAKATQQPPQQKTKPASAKQSTSALMGMDSDESSEDEAPTAPVISKGQPMRSAHQALSLDETSSDDDDDVPPTKPVADRAPAPAPAPAPAQTKKPKLTAKEKKAQLQAKAKAAKEVQRANELRQLEAKRIDLNETSDDEDSDSDTQAKKPVTKKFLNLNESSDTSDDSSDDEPAPAVVNKNGKRVAPSQLIQTSKNAPKAPAAPAPARTRTMRKL